VTIGVADDLLTVARIVRSHGVRGELKIMCSAHQLEAFQPGVAVFIDRTEYEVAEVRGHTDKPILRLMQITDRNAADALRGSSIEMHRSQLPEPEDDEWLVADLVGCTVYDGERKIGMVSAVDLPPANPVLVVHLVTGGEILVPLIDDAVPAVNIDARSIAIDAAFLGLDSVDEEDPEEGDQ
jgi:16S rRNA processing protein RimM